MQHDKARSDLKCNCEHCKRNGNADTKNWTWWNLYNHRNRHYNKQSGRISCYICGSKFGRRNELESHLGYIHHISKYLKYECPSCRKPFTNMSHCRQHILARTCARQRERIAKNQQELLKIYNEMNT